MEVRVGVTMQTLDEKISQLETSEAKNKLAQQQQAARTRRCNSAMICHCAAAPHPGVGVSSGDASVADASAAAPRT